MSETEGTHTGLTSAGHSQPCDDDCDYCGYCDYCGDGGNDCANYSCDYWRDGCAYCN